MSLGYIWRFAYATALFFLAKATQVCHYNSKSKGIAILVSKLKDDGQTQGIVLFYLWE